MIPAWNEASRLPSTLDRYLPALERWAGPYEIVVVADGNRDGTANLARAYALRGVRVLEFPTKLGKGGAIMAGLLQSRFEHVGYLDADGPIPPDQVLRMSELLGETDGVVASRWIQGASFLRQEPRFNLLAGRLWNFLVRSLLFLPLRDTQCGAKFFRRAVILRALRAVALTNRAFDVDVLYHMRKSGDVIREVPVSWTHNSETRMPIGRAIPIMFLSLVGVRLMNLPVARWLPRKWIAWFTDIVSEKGPVS